MKKIRFHRKDAPPHAQKTKKRAAAEKPSAVALCVFSDTKTTTIFCKFIFTKYLLRFVDKPMRTSRPLVTEKSARVGHISLFVVNGHAKISGILMQRKIKGACRFSLGQSVKARGLRAKMQEGL